MKPLFKLRLSFISIAIISSACANNLSAPDQSQNVLPEVTPAINQVQALNIIWNALEPNTSSHKRSNWMVEEVRLAAGRDIFEPFEGDPAPGCWSGPKPAGNEKIDSGKNYWYVVMTPMPATPMPVSGTPSPTAPPLIPEPFLRQAYFLVDPVTGDVVARKLICVIY